MHSMDAASAIKPRFESTCNPQQIFIEKSIVALVTSQTSFGNTANTTENQSLLSSEFCLNVKSVYVYLGRDVSCS